MKNGELEASEEKLALLEKLIDNSSVDSVALENFIKDNYPDQYKDMRKIQELIEDGGKRRNAAK